MASARVLALKVGARAIVLVNVALEVKVTRAIFWVFYMVFECEGLIEDL